MEGSVRSGGVIKKKSSSGCLIIKKKCDNRNLGGGFGGLGSGSNDNVKEKKRPRLVESDSSSSDEDQSLEFMRRKVNDRRLSNGGIRDYHRSNAGMEISDERKRSRLDLFEFDEYDEFDGKRMRNEFDENRYEIVARKGGRDLNEYGVGSSSRSLMVDKRKQDSYFEGSNSGRSRGSEHRGSKYQEMASEPIRLQGKNGVLKVMVNKKKRMEFPSQRKIIDPRHVEERKGSRSRDVVDEEFLAPIPVYSEGLNPAEKRGSLIKTEKTELKLEKVKPMLSKGYKAKDLEIDGTDTSLKLAPPGIQGIQIYSSKKKLKREAERSSPAENVTPVKGKEVAKEGKGKRGCSTEKQLLREKIRGMLIESGWTIDYRPRKNRDYLDAVYINPSGTAFWSIIKAYDALKKQLGEDNDRTKVDIVSPSFAPIAEDLIHKLTRQTRKKIEDEMKRKRKEGAPMSKSAKKPAVTDNSDSDQSEEKLNSYVKQNHDTNKGGNSSDDDSSDDSWKRKSKKVRGENTLLASNSNFLQGRTSKVGRCTLLVRGSNRGENSEFDGYIPYSGKRTVLAWLIDSGTAQLSEKVQYMNKRRNRVMLEGWITGEGIHCGCCSKILTVSKFELHAGSKLRQPFQNMFLESGASLLQCQVDAWNKQDESFRQAFHTVDIHGDDPDDDTCGLCGDGGDLICCDSCPSTYHQICLGIQILPSGDWHCPNCTCKFCGDASANVAEENDSTDELTGCSFCEKKFHKSCSGDVCTLPTTSNDAYFCGLKCQEIHDHLQKILGVKHELESGFSWSLIQRADVSDTSHHGFHQRVECNSKLAVALSVMDECFLPINDRRSGINMMHNVVYNCGSNFNRLNYSGFYTVILERGDEIISAASIRIHGTLLAEMPFIGTRAIYRRQGMCRRLLSAIETELGFLNVEQLIIPAISEHMNTWTTVFGFHQLEDDLKKEIKTLNMLVFPGTDMLQKHIVKQESPDGTKVTESVKIHPHESSAALGVKSDMDSPVEHNKQTAEDSGKFLESTNSYDLNSLDSGSPSPAIPSNDNNASIVSNAESGSLDLPTEDNTNSSEIEAPRLESVNDSSDETLNAAPEVLGNSPALEKTEELINVEGNVDSSMKVSQESEPQVIVNNDLNNSPPGSGNEAFDTVEDKVNEEPISSSTPVIEEDKYLAQTNSDLNQPTVVPVIKSELNSAINTSPTANNGSSLEVSPNKTVAIETPNLNQNPVCVSDFADSRESNKNSEEDHEAVIQVKNELASSALVQKAVDLAETNNTTPSPELVNGKVDSSIPSPEVLAHTTTATTD